MRPLRSVLIGLAVVMLGATSAEAINLKKIALRYATNDFAAGTTDGGCGATLGTEFPRNKVLAIEDVVCEVLGSLRPLANDEKFRLSLVDGGGCGGRVVLATTFGSLEGLRYSPRLPLYAGPDMSVRMLRTSSENALAVGVHCRFVGTFASPP